MDDLDHRNLGVQTQTLAPAGRCAGHGVLASARLRDLPGAGGLSPAQDAPAPAMPRSKRHSCCQRTFWGRSGHWDKFREHMFRVDDGDHDDGTEADVVPLPRADLQQGSALVARASDPLCRIWRLPSQ